MDLGRKQSTATVVSVVNGLSVLMLLHSWLLLGLQPEVTLVSVSVRDRQRLTPGGKVDACTAQLGRYARLLS